MSERFEQWKAREKIRSDIGWIVILCGLSGALCLVLGVLAWFGVAKVRGPGGAFAPLIGLALLAMALGVWNGKPWGRVSFLVFNVVCVLEYVVRLFLDGPGSGNALWTLVSVALVVHLLRPATRRRFERASGQTIGAS